LNVKGKKLILNLPESEQFSLLESDGYWFDRNWSIFPRNNCHDNQGEKINFKLIYPIVYRNLIDAVN
jgi:hypothetical protein